MVIIGIDLDSVEALEILVFKLDVRALTIYNYFRRDKGKPATFFRFMLVQHNLLILSTNNDLLGKRWEKPNSCNEERQIEIKKYSN